MTDSDDVVKYKYDKQGNLESYDDGFYVTNYNNSYDRNNCLKKRVYLNDKTKITFKYKKIRVRKKYARQIKQQQWALQNNEVQFILPIYSD